MRYLVAILFVCFTILNANNQMNIINEDVDYYICFSDTIQLYNPNIPLVMIDKSNICIAKGDSVTKEKTFEYKDDYYIQIQHNNIKYFARSSDFIRAYAYYIRQFPTSFPVPKEQDAQVWSIALDYILSNSSMKVKTQTDMFIETYSPNDYDQYGYSVNKIVQKDIYIYKIKAINKVIGYCDECLKAHEFAAYLQKKLK